MMFTNETMVEQAVRAGEMIGGLSYNKRFHFYGKRISVAEAQRYIVAMVEAFIAELAAKTVAPFAEQAVMSVKEAAAMLKLSEARIRRMTEEGKLSYSRRSHVYAHQVYAIAERRASR